MDIQALLFWQKTTPELPWQNDHDPYHQWLLEIMLQQTTTATIINRFYGWLEIFPTLNSLAAAEEQAVLAAWEGLGYYNRARNLHKAAKIIRQSGWPASYTTMIKLPGIGHYTACALLSRFYNQPLLAVDANLKRIFMRQQAKTTFSPADEQFWLRTLMSAMEQHGSAPINYALMRLGQLLCTARSADCLNCPLKDSCQVFEHQLIKEFTQPVKKSITKISSLVLVLTTRSKLFVEYRREGIGAGLYTLPRYDLNEKAALEERYGIAQSLPSLHHHYTRYKELLNPLFFTIDDETLAPLQGQWVFFKELKQLPFLSVYRQIIQQLDLPDD